MDLSYFLTENLRDAGLQFFNKQLGIELSQYTVTPISVHTVLSPYLKNQEWLNSVSECHFLGLVDENALKRATATTGNLFANEPTDINQIAAAETGKYKAVSVFILSFKAGIPISKTLIGAYTRAFNRWFRDKPVILLTRYQDKLSFSTALREPYKRSNLHGEKVGTISMLKDINLQQPHTGHIKILQQLDTRTQHVRHYEDLYRLWKSVFDIQTLNNAFYKELQQWFYWAIKEIKLPFIPDHISKEEGTKNFLVRTLARTMFCWFLKEKGLIRRELLELENYRFEKYPLIQDIDEKGFLKSNSYYRGVLQNIFYYSLNKQEKSGKKDFKWTKYLNKNFNYDWLVQIPYLNGGIFDELKPDDNAKESIEDSVLKIPNELFYGNGKEHNGLNQIFNGYKFTIEENTPYEEDIALDPELLGLVFENLLAELDPNLEESTIKSIRKLTGAYYTPRRIIQEMVNESLLLYLTNYFEGQQVLTDKTKQQLRDIIYLHRADEGNTAFCTAVVEGLDQMKVLDPACGSGAFPMGMLHSMVDMLKLVDADNSKWVELKLKRVDKNYRAEFKKILTQHMDDYSRKLGIIRDSIYGIDIQPLAVQITKLRFFISLLIEQKTENGIMPMPNIETKIICADTLRNITVDLFAQQAIEELKEARLQYYKHQITPKERDDLAEQIAALMHTAFPRFAEQVTGKKEIAARNKALLKEWFEHATISAPFFNMDFFYPEVKEAGGFDVVIGNPPYGGTKITDEVRSALNLESKDPYGAFIARFLGSGQQATPLKHRGVLAYIVSDTFMTIKSHLPLRRQMMDNYIHKMIRVHPDTFRATVNTAIIICERNLFNDKNVEGHLVKTFKENHQVLMGDLSNVSIHENHERFVDLLHLTMAQSSDKESESYMDFAYYTYPQIIIHENSGLPFFVASPKLFSLMNDGDNLKRDNVAIGKNELKATVILINGKMVKLVKLGEIANVKQGLATGDNEGYLFQNPEARGRYRSIEDHKQFLLSENDLKKIRNDEELRLEVIEKGISKGNIKSKRYFSGRYILPYDKGGESDSEEGWMPNYWVTTDYYIDWSEWAVKRLKSLTTQERNQQQGLEGGDNRLCSRFQNVDSYFLEGITFSPTGIYSPTFRLHLPSVYDKEGSCIFTDIIIHNILIAFLSSKLFKYFQKTVVNGTVHSMQGDIDEGVIVVGEDFAAIKSLVQKIVSRQKQMPRYDYASHEQIQIDKLVYEAYGLSAEDIEEVETWYKRRYPKLAKAQEENLKRLGKSTDWMVLYGFK